METDKSETQIADANWQRYEYGRQRGHQRYCAQARLNDNFYLGGGLQWSDDVRAELGDRPSEEVNEILPSVNAAVGYQIANRMDVAYLPVGRGADEDTAKTLSRVVKQLLTNARYHWKETDVFADGMIEQRGYFDIRLDLDESLTGDLSIDVLDPMDVIPDPDSKSYDPDDWYDVTVSRWLLVDEIAQFWGKERADAVVNSLVPDDDWEEGMEGEERSKFGDNTGGYDSVWSSGGAKRYRIIDRQYRTYERSLVMISPEGDVRPADHLTADQTRALLNDGWLKTRRMQRRIRWCVTSSGRVLHNELSPYRRFTIIPYFPYFRRGKTRGMVDNAISPQRIMNKSISQLEHIVNTSANSGWQGEENQLVNMTDDELAERGAETGLVLIRRQGTQPLQKITPNQVPTGIEHLFQISRGSIRDTTGINDAMRAEQKSSAESGIAIQSRQFAAQQQLAVPLDNLARTRNMVAQHVREIVQTFYTEERVIRIAETDSFGRPVSIPLTVNQVAVDGSILNDLTVGDYDVSITEQPMQVTFENSQFQQALELRKEGVNIPDQFLIRLSNIADKADLMEMVSGETQPDPRAEAEAEKLAAQAEQIREDAALKRWQARKAAQEAVNKGVESQFSATTAANLIAGNPAIAPLADAMLRSAGYEDQDAAPIIPEPAGVLSVAELPENTNPLTPPNPDVGITAGIESGNVPEVMQ